MTDPPSDGPSDEASDEPSDEREPDWQRRRRLAEVFGDVLPDTTADERDPADRSGDAEQRGDTWLKEQVPPHHGG